MRITMISQDFLRMANCHLRSWSIFLVFPFFLADQLCNLFFQCYPNLSSWNWRNNCFLYFLECVTLLRLEFTLRRIFHKLSIYAFEIWKEHKNRLAYGRYFCLMTCHGVTGRMQFQECYCKPSNLYSHFVALWNWW